MLISRDSLNSILKQLDKHLKKEVEIVLVGGGALLVLTPDSTATRDLDAFPTDTLKLVQAALFDLRDKIGPVDLNIRSAGFESYLPEGWDRRIVLSEEFSGASIKVYTPTPEDLAVMKVFRFNAKDAQDIARLAALSQFKRDEFKKRFLSVLAVAIGEPRWHAQSFSMIWNRLFPDDAIETDDLLKMANRTDENDPAPDIG